MSGFRQIFEGLWALNKLMDDAHVRFGVRSSPISGEFAVVKVCGSVVGARVRVEGVVTPEFLRDAFHPDDELFDLIDRKIAQMIENGRNQPFEPFESSDTVEIRTVPGAVYIQVPVTMGGRKVRPAARLARRDAALTLIKSLHDAMERAWPVEE